MKLILHIIIIVILTLNLSAFAEKKDCSEFKKFSKKHISCKAHNLKTETKNKAGKIKKKTGSILKASTGIFKKN